jgi:hypothetical protein
MNYYNDYPYLTHIWFYILIFFILIDFFLSVWLCINNKNKSNTGRDLLIFTKTFLFLIIFIPFIYLFINKK